MPLFYVMVYGHKTYVTFSLNSIAAPKSLYSRFFITRTQRGGASNRSSYGEAKYQKNRSSFGGSSYGEFIVKGDMKDY